MGSIRKKFMNEISATKDILASLLENIIDKIALKQEYTLDDYFGFIDLMV
jgi:hypothetical protein